MTKTISFLDIENQVSRCGICIGDKIRTYSGHIGIVKSFTESGGMFVRIPHYACTNHEQYVAFDRFRECEILEKAKPGQWIEDQKDVNKCQ